LIAALRQIYKRLRKDPCDFGESLYRLPALKLVLCQAVIARLLVDYAIHEDLPLVFIRGVKVVR
jgi:hypothetical protein